MNVDTGKELEKYYLLGEEEEQNAGKEHKLCQRVQTELF